MEKLIHQEILKNITPFLKNENGFTPSYQEQRKAALKFFEAKGIPTKKDENWIYTSIAKNLSSRFIESSSPRPVDQKLIIDLSQVIVLNNGIYNSEDSKLPQGLKKIAPQIPRSFHDQFDAINLVSATDAVGFCLEKNHHLKNPITIIHQTDEFAVNKQVTPRIYFQAEDNSQAQIVEIFTSTQNNLFQYTTNSHISFDLGRNAQISHIKINLEAKNSTHIGLIKAQVARDASFKSFVIDLGIKLSRNNVDLHLNDQNANVESHGLYYLKDTEHADNFISIHHHAPHTISEQLYKGILNHDSHGAFTGKIEIDQDCSGANAAQLNKNLLLSKKAHINTRPQLLVATDDVKCAHGATIGDLSAEEEFYLTSRGISKARAKQMLAMGFAHEVVYKINDPKIIVFINHLLNDIGI
jgi:Fe-S cluster assembly protein SufD